MNYHRLRVFYTVARHLSFSRAAEELYTSQPNVSRHIAKLEAELGVSLFHRLGTQVALTDAGRMVYDYAQRVFELTEGLQRTLNELKGLERGYLRLGASSTPGLYLLPPHLAGFRTRYPGLDVTLHLGNSQEIVAQVLSNSLDLGFVEGYAGVAGIQVQPFVTDELVFIAPAGHRLAGQAELEPQDLAEETFIWREQGSGTREAMEAMLDRLGIRPALDRGKRPARPSTSRRGELVEPSGRRSLELRSCEGVKRAVAAGMGISFVSKHAVELELAQGLLAVLEGPDTSATPVLSSVEGLSTSLRASRDLSIVSHKDVRPSAAALAFLAYLRKGI